MKESELRDILAEQLNVLEPGLSLLSTEKYIPSDVGTRSFIDILAQDARGKWVLIELKRSDAAAREAIHEVNKYVETVKRHLGARDDEIRAIIASTAWKELLLPFSRFVSDTSIDVKGVQLIVDDVSKAIGATEVVPIPIKSGRVLSPWHEIRLYRNEDRMLAGIDSYDVSCKVKGIKDYVMVVMIAPPELYERSVRATAMAIGQLGGSSSGVSTEADIALLASKMPRADFMIYFVPQLQTTDEYLEIIRRSPELYEEAKEFERFMEGDELLQSLQSHAFDTEPRVTCDHFEIGYPAKFKTKLLDTEGWRIDRLIRRGAFERNALLSDETIFGEISGEAGTSGQVFKRTISCSDRSACSQLRSDVRECLSNNALWSKSICEQVEECIEAFPEGEIEVSVFAPSTGLMTIFFVISHEDGAGYVPTYTVQARMAGELRRAYVGNLVSRGKKSIGPDRFRKILEKYYNGDLGSLVMSMTWGAYDARDVDIMEDLELEYASFRFDDVKGARQFYKMKGERWRKIEPISHTHAAFKSYLERNPRLMNVIACKLSPRIGAGVCDGSSAARQLEALVEGSSASSDKCADFASIPCSVCGISLVTEEIVSSTIDDNSIELFKCADCSIYFATGASMTVYKREAPKRWRVVADAVFLEPQYQLPSVHE